MKNAILLLIIINLFLITAAGYRMKGAPTGEKRFGDGAPATKPGGSPAKGSDGTKPGNNFVDAFQNKGGADAPPGMEGVVGANRPTYDITDEDPNAHQDRQAEGLKDAKGKIGLLPGGGKKK